jgi:AcrR family transcriptional regulator
VLTPGKQARFPGLQNASTSTLGNFVTVPKNPARSDPHTILAVVATVLEDRGYDGWTLQDVALRAHVSLTTIYKQFPSRDELIVAAVERWMDQHVYRPIPELSENQTLFQALAVMFQTIFEPWEAHPAMLQVFVQACAANGRQRLRAQGQAALDPLRTAFENLDSDWADDINMILTNVVEGALSRYLNGEIRITEILTNLERTLSRLDQVVPNRARPAKRPRPHTPSVSPRTVKTNQR